MSKFSMETEVTRKVVEEFLSKNAYLSGCDLPGKEDAELLNTIKSVPCQKTCPNVFSWWWNLNMFQEPVRALWGQCKEKPKK